MKIKGRQACSLAAFQRLYDYGYRGVVQTVVPERTEHEGFTEPATACACDANRAPNTPSVMATVVATRRGLLMIPAMMTLPTC